MTNWSNWVIFCVCCAAGCSSDGTSKATPQECTDAQAKLSTCGLTINQSCDATSGNGALCVSRCIANASCQELSAADKKTSFTTCQAICQGAKADDFICDDLKAYVPGSGRCDGRAQCPDGSDEANCARGAGGSNAGMGPGGNASGTGGNVATGGGGGSPVAAPTCGELADHEVSVCAGMSRDSWLERCNKSSQLYVPEGCAESLGEYRKCAVSAKYDCQSGPMGCDSLISGYITCQSRFVNKTGCVRLEGDDSQCSGGAYAFGCQAALPPNCTMSQAGAVCCSAFGPS